MQLCNHGEQKIRSLLPLRKNPDQKVNINKGATTHVSFNGVTVLPYTREKSKLGPNE